MMRRLSALQPSARFCAGWQLVDRAGVPAQNMHTLFMRPAGPQFVLAYGAGLGDRKRPGSLLPRSGDPLLNPISARPCSRSSARNAVERATCCGSPRPDSARPAMSRPGAFGPSGKCNFKDCNASMVISRLTPSSRSWANRSRSSVVSILRSVSPQSAEGFNFLNMPT